MGEKFEYMGWQVSSRAILIDRLEPEIRIEIEVLCVDRELDQLLPLLEASEHYVRVFDEVDYDVLPAFVDITYTFLERQYGPYIDTESLQSIYNALHRLPIPLMGSPPVAWETLERVLAPAGHFGTAVLIAHQVGETSLPVLILFGTGMTVVINILQPTTKAFGDALAERIRRWGLADKGAGNK